MRRLGARAVGVEGGDVILFSDVEDEGPMWAGRGRRESRAQVFFSEPFLDPPSVQVALTMWDVSSETNARVDVRAEDVGREGFAIVFRTWGDTRVARVRVGWTAIGPLRDEDAWDVD